ncbi:MAG: hypothetical protein R3F43_03520 [bacterium]
MDQDVVARRRAPGASALGIQPQAQALCGVGEDVLGGRGTRPRWMTHAT